MSVHEVAIAELGVGGALMLVAAVMIPWARFRAVRVPRGDFRWPSPPTVWVHPGVDMVTVAKAAAVWSGLGHKIGPVKIGESSATGIHVQPDDGTLLSLNAMSWRELAAATSIVPSVPRATILIAQDQVLDIATAVHEIAHAFDYSHPQLWPPTGHVMHPDGSRRGMDTRGLEGP